MQRPFIMQSVQFFGTERRLMRSVQRFAAALVAGALSTGPALAASDGAPTVTATGTCVADVVPDQAELTVTLTRQGLDAARISADATGAFNAFRRDVEALRLPQPVLTSNGLSLQRIVDGTGAKPVFRGYIASAGLRVESSDAARLAEVIPLAASSRIDDVGEILLSLSDRQLRATEIACLPRASADARARATALAEGLGLSIGAVQTIADVRQGVRPPRPGPLQGRMTAASSPEVSVGLQRVEVTTTVTFTLAAPRK